MEFGDKSGEDAGSHRHSEVNPEVCAKLAVLKHVRVWVRDERELPLGDKVIVLVPDEELEGERWIFEATVDIMRLWPKSLILEAADGVAAVEGEHNNYRFK